MDPLRSAEAMPLVRDCSQSPEIRHISTAKGRLKAQSPNIDLSSEGFSDADLERTRLIIRDLLRRGMIEELHNEGELDPYGHNKELKATVGIELEVAALDAKTGAPTRSGPKIIEHLRQKRREERRVHGVWTEELGASFAERVFEERPIGDRLAEKIQTDINGAYQEFRQAQAEMGLVEEVAGVALPPNLTAEQMGEDWLTPADRFDRLTEYALKVRQGSISVSLRTRDTNEEVKVDYPGIAPWFASLQINVQPENREMLLKLANLASAFSGLLLAGTVSSPFFAGETCSKESRLEVFSQAWDMGRFGDNRVLDSIQDYFAQTLDHAPILFEDDFVRSPEIEHDKDGDPDTRMQRYIAAIRKDILDDEKRGDYQTSYGTPYLTFHAGTIHNNPRIKSQVQNGKLVEWLELRNCGVVPSAHDNAANVILNLGLLYGMYSEMEAGKFSMDDVKSYIKDGSSHIDYEKAKRDGLEAKLNVPGLDPNQTLAEQHSDLMLLCGKGLLRLGLPTDECKEHLRTLKARLQMGLTEADWMIKRKEVLESRGVEDPMAQLSLELIQCAKFDIPVHLRKIDGESLELEKVA